MGGKHPCETIFLYRGCVKSLNSPLCLTFDTPFFLYLSINICSQIGLKAVQRVCGNIDGYISTLRTTTIGCVMRQSCRTTSPVSRESAKNIPTMYISVRTSKDKKSRLPSPDFSLTQNMLRMVKCWLTVCLWN